MASAVSRLCCLAVFVSALVSVCGHGRMLLPPSRASAWRLGFDTPKDYNDMGCNCGGVTNQWITHGGKCGICGDPWEQAVPRAHERPSGTYVKKGPGFVLSSYNQGETMTVSVELTAPHKGYFEFYVCNVDQVPGRLDADSSCLQLLPLTTGGFRFPVTHPEPRKYSPTVILPTDLTCNHCVFQWKYHAGNSNGCFNNGTCCLGCGIQEEFYSCADIEIRSHDGSLPTTPKPAPTTSPMTTTTTTTPTTTPFWWWPWWKSTTETPPVDTNPLSDFDRKFYTCNYCYRECIKNGRPENCPNICKDLGWPDPRACPRNLLGF